MNLNSLLTLLIFFSLSLLFLSNCNDSNNPFGPPDYSSAPEAFSTDGITPIVKDNGLIIYIVEEGTSHQVLIEKDIFLTFYTGRLTSGKIFDSSYRNGNTVPTQFSLNQTNQNTGEFSLIEGFRKGLLGMKEGEKRKIIIPPALAYEGTSSNLAKDTLIFDVELAQILSLKRTN